MAEVGKFRLNVLRVGRWYSLSPLEYVRGIHGQNLAEKWLKWGFSGNTHIFFYFFFKVFSETRTKNGGIHVFFGVRTWSLWWYSFKPGDFWWSWRPYTWLGPRAGAERVFQCFFARFGPQAVWRWRAETRKKKLEKRSAPALGPSQV